MMTANLVRFYPSLMFTNMVIKSLTLSELPLQWATNSNSYSVFSPSSSKQTDYERNHYTANEIQNDTIKPCVHTSIFHPEFTAMSIRSVLGSIFSFTYFTRNCILKGRGDRTYIYCLQALCQVYSSTYSSLR